MTRRRTAIRCPASASALFAAIAAYAPAVATAQDLDLFERPAETTPPAALPALDPASTVVLTGEELYLRGYRTLGEALTDLVGIDWQRTTRGTRYGARGVPLGILVVIDGVPEVVSGERAFADLDEGLDLADVERVEVVRGPASALAGVGALAGLVRITLRRPDLSGARVRLGTTHLGEREFGGEATARYGRLAARAVLLHRQGPAGVWRLRGVPTRFIRVGTLVVPGQKEDVDIYVDDDASTAARAEVDAGPLWLDARWTRTDLHSPVSSFSHGLLRPGAQQRAQRDRLRLRLRWHHDAGPARIEAALQASRHLRDEVIPLFPRGGAYSHQGAVELNGRTDQVQALLRALFPLARHHLLLSVLYGDASLLVERADGVDPRDGTRYDRLIELEQLAATAQAAIEYQGDFGDGLHLTAGAGIEWHTGFPPAAVPRASLVYQLRPELGLRISYAAGARNPDRYDVGLLAQAMMAGWALGPRSGADLAPERTHTAEAALRYLPSSALRGDLALFATYHENSVEHLVSGARLGAENLPPRTVLGGEARVTVWPVPHLLYVRSGLSVARTVYGPPLESHTAAAVGQVEVTPLRGIGAGVRWRATWRDANDTAAGVAGRIDAYGFVSALGGRLRLTVAVRNALDSREPSFDAAALGGTADVAVPARGRVVYAAIEGTL